MSTGLSQLRVRKPSFGSSQTHFFDVVVVAADLAFFFVDFFLATDSRSTVRKTADTPDGSFAAPAKPMRTRLVLVTFVFLPFFVTVLVRFDVSLIDWLFFGREIVTVGGAPSVSFTGWTTAGLDAPWRSTTTSCTTTVPSLAYVCWTVGVVVVSVLPSPKFHWYWTRPPPIAPSRSVDALASKVTGWALRGFGVATVNAAVGTVLTNSSAPRSLPLPSSRGWPSMSVAESPAVIWPLLSAGESVRRW